MGKVHDLNLSQTKVEDVSALGGVHTLDLSHTQVEEVSALGRVHTLDLRRTEVKDVSMLGGVHKLILEGTSVSDVSALGGVYHLNINNLQEVKGLEKLTGNNTIEMISTFGEGTDKIRCMNLVVSRNMPVNLEFSKTIPNVSKV